MNRTTNRARRMLLSTVSAAALLGSLGTAAADDAGRPVLWFELGGQFERMQSSQEPFAPPLVAVLDTNPFTHPESLQKLPSYAFDEDGRISFQPDGSDWVFSASIRVGRSDGGNKHTHEQTAPPSPQFLESIPAFSFYRKFPVSARAERFGDTVARESEKLAIIDFQAGKDIGLGMLGAGASSTLSAGIRFAQFRSRSSVAINADPDFTVTYKYATNINHYFYGKFSIPQQHWHLYAAQEQLQRSFRGLGPLLSWDASELLVGNPQSEGITLDWGLNAAVLFGRQKVKGNHHTSAHYNSAHHFNNTVPLVYDHHGAIDRSHTVSVPNIGGFAGLSLRFPNAKISLGYRADYYFNAMDGGLAARKSEDRGFFGPFASISVGVGD